jgi:hypothetical protein
MDGPYTDNCIFLQKVHIFWEGHKNLQNLQRRSNCYYTRQIHGGGFAKICGLLRIYELYLHGGLHRVSFALKFDAWQIFIWLPKLSLVESSSKEGGHFKNIVYTSGFLRRPKESDKISHLIWRLPDKFQINWAISSYFCCLLKKLELYQDHTLKISHPSSEKISPYCGTVRSVKRRSVLNCISPRPVVLVQWSIF